MLNISPVNFIKMNTITNVQPKRNYGLASDVFVKSANGVSFKGAEKAESSSFIKWAEETNFVKEQLEGIISNPENKMGSGFSHTAYNIPNNKEYIIRTPNYESPYKLQYENAKIEDTEDKNLDINIGQEVAYITIPTGQGLPYTVEVLRRQHGESIGVQPPETLVTGEYNPTTKEGVAPYEDYSRKEKYARTIHKVAELPVESYEKLISDFSKACKAGYMFDHLNSNNLLVDSEGKSINLIDMDKSSQSTTPNYANLLYSLTNVSYLNTYNSSYPNPVSDDDKNKVIGDTIQIIDKFVQAMKTQGVKFDRENRSFEFAMHLENSLPFTFFCRAFDSEQKWQVLEKMGVA